MAEDQAQPWRQDAYCLGDDTEEWFPHKGDGCDYALSVCDVCPVWGECLLHALRTSEQYGVHGRLRHIDRRHLKETIRDLEAPPTDAEILCLADDLAEAVRADLAERAAQRETMSKLSEAERNKTRGPATREVAALADLLRSNPGEQLAIVVEHDGVMPHPFPTFTAPIPADSAEDSEQLGLFAA